MRSLSLSLNEGRYFFSLSIFVLSITVREMLTKARANEEKREGGSGSSRGGGKRTSPLSRFPLPFFLSIYKTNSSASSFFFDSFSKATS